MQNELSSRIVPDRWNELENAESTIANERVIQSDSISRTERIKSP